MAEIDPQASVATNSDANIGRANTSPQAVGAGQRTQGRYAGNGTLGAHRAIPSRDPNWSRAPVPIDPEQTTSCLTLLCSQALAYCAVRDITGAPGIAGIASSIFLRGDFEGGFSTCPPPNLWLYNHLALFLSVVKAAHILSISKSWADCPFHFRKGNRRRSRFGFYPYCVRVSPECLP